jgi:selenocysteine lyase/cysteine desulfurase
VEPAAVLAALRPDTRLVALTHCSNVTGAVNPVEEIAARLKGTGVPLLVDGAQSAGCRPIDLEAAGIDLFAAPGHKGLYGPPGTGFLYIAPGVDPGPLLHGGTGGASAGLDQPLELPERFESGTQNTPALAGLLAGLEFLAQKGVAAVQAHEQALVGLLLEGLGSMPGVTVYNGTPGRPRGAVVSFTVAGHDPATIGFRLDREFGISVRVGLHCAPLAHETIGTFPEGTVRVSPGLFNTEEDILRFIAAVGRICGVAP